MWARLIGLLFCSALLASVASAADGNKVLFSPWSSAPTCTTGRSCIYMLASDGQLYVIDGNAVTTKLHGAKSFRTSANCAGLSGPVNGDVCYDTTLGYFRLYAGGWKTIPTAVSAPLALSGQTISIAASGVVYSSVVGAGKGVVGVATLYLVGPGVVASGTTEAILWLAVRAGTVKNLRCFLGVAPGGADTVIVTLRKNAADQTTTCTITGVATTCSDTSNTFSVVAADQLSVKAVSSAGVASDLTCSFEVTN